MRYLIITINNTIGIKNNDNKNTILGKCFFLLSQPQTYLLNIMLEKAILKQNLKKNKTIN